VATKPSCYYCQRSFENEEVLISHQKLLHFRCPECGKKFSNIPGMAYHMKIVHSMELQAVPKADPGRDDPSLNVVGSTGIPTEEEREERAQKKLKPSPIDQLVDSVVAEVSSSSAAASNSSDSGSYITPSSITIKGLVYSDETVSPEEKRALLPKYRIDEATLREKFAAKDASIEARLKMALASRNRSAVPSE